LIENVKGLKRYFLVLNSRSIAKGAKSTIREISGHIEGINSQMEAMTEDEKKQLE
jgi:glutamine synthetase